MKERRFRRFSVKSLDIFTDIILSDEVSLVDIGLGGACIQTTQSLKRGSDYSLRIDMEGAALLIKCTVIWDNLSGSIKTFEGKLMPAYLVGVKFKDVDKKLFDELRGFFSGIGSPEDEKFYDEHRINGTRFKIHEEETALLKYQKRFDVRKISLGGMLIKGESRIEPESMHTMELYLPDDPLPTRFLGRIASCVEVFEGNSMSFEIGIEFLEIEENDRERLSSFIHSLYQL
jgi:hypothetical protein